MKWQLTLLGLLVGLLGFAYGGVLRDVEFEELVVEEDDTPSPNDVSWMFQLIMDCVNKKLEDEEVSKIIETEVDFEKDIEVRGGKKKHHHGKKGIGALLGLDLKDISGALLANVNVKDSINDNNINIPILSSGVHTAQEVKFRPGHKKHGSRSFNDFFAAQGGINVGTNNKGNNNQVATQTSTSGSSINQFSEFFRATATNDGKNEGEAGVVISATNMGDGNALGIQQGGGGGSFNLVSNFGPPEGRAARGETKGGGVGGLLGLVLNDLSFAGVANVPIKHVLNDNNINVPILSNGVTTVQEFKDGGDDSIIPDGDDTGDDQVGGLGGLGGVLSGLLRSATSSNIAANTGDKGVVIDAINQGNGNALGISQGFGGKGDFKLASSFRSNNDLFQKLALFHAMKNPGFPSNKFFANANFNNDLASAFGGTNVATNNFGNQNQIASQTHASNSHISQGLF